MSDKTVRIKYEMDTEEAKVKLQAIKTETRIAEAEVDRVAVKSKWTATKIVATLMLVQSFVMAYVESIFGTLSHTARAIIQQGFLASQLMTYHAVGATIGGNPALAAMLFAASSYISIHTAQLQEQGEKELTAELNAAKAQLYRLSSYARLYMG